MVKTEKISSIAFIGTSAVSLIITILFLTVGYDEVYDANPEFNAPVLTDLFICLMYALVAGVIGCCIWSVVHSIMQGGNGGDTANRVPGGKVTAITIGTLIVSLVVGLVFGLGETDFRAADGTITTAGWVTLVDVFMWSMYILSIVLIIMVVLVMGGVIRKTNVAKK